MRQERNTIKFYGICYELGKKKFLVQGAKTVSMMMRRRFDTNHHAYRCRSCGWWHVGSHERFRRTTAPRPRVVTQFPTGGVSA